MSDELKPCPFCGKEPQREMHSFQGKGRGAIYRCSNSECPNRRFDWFSIEEWNTRPLEDALRKQLEELEFYKLDAKASRSALDKLLLEYYSLRKQLEIAVEAMQDANGCISYDQKRAINLLETALAEIEKIEQG